MEQDSKLHRLVYANDLIGIESLLAHKQNKDYVIGKHDVTLRTALHYACDRNQYEIVKCILNHTHDKTSLLNKQDVDGHTALHLACCFNHREIVNLLLKYNADPLLKTRLGRNAIDTALSRGYVGITVMLLHSVEESLWPEILMGSQRVYEMSAWHYAIVKGFTNMIQTLLSMCSNLLARKLVLHCDFKTGKTSFHLAAEHGHDSIFRILMHYGECDQQDFNGLTPYQLAYQHKHVGILQLLWDAV